MHQEGQVSRIPKQVRNMTMREFGDKYNGNIQAALRGFQKEKFAASGGEGSLGELDKDARKRKWMASQEAEAENGREVESSKALKNRMVRLCYAFAHFSEFNSSPDNDFSQEKGWVVNWARDCATCAPPCRWK